MRSLRVASFLCVTGLAASSWAAPIEDSFELKIRWGDLALLGEMPADTPAADLTPASQQPRSTDVRQVLFYQPRIIEKPPYEPGIRMNDNVTNVIIATGGAALLTSVIVEMLR